MQFFSDHQSGMQFFSDHQSGMQFFSDHHGIIIIYHSRLTSTFSHLGWFWSRDDCPPHSLNLHHVLLHSQQVHILHHTITPFFSRPSCRPSPLNSHLSQHPPSPLCPFHMSKPYQSSLLQLNTSLPPHC